MMEGFWSSMQIELLNRRKWKPRVELANAIFECIEIFHNHQTPPLVSTTLENEAIATVENEATQTDWMGDLGGGLGVDQAACCGWGSAAAGRAAVGDRSVDG